MKAILEFDLNNPDESMSHLRATKSTAMAITLHEIQCNLRRDFEKIIEKNTKEDIADLILERINDVYQQNNININELIN